jgi:hypothetical protein
MVKSASDFFQSILSIMTSGISMDLGLFVFIK